MSSALARLPNEQSDMFGLSMTRYALRCLGYDMLTLSYPTHFWPLNERKTSMNTLWISLASAAGACIALQAAANGSLRANLGDPRYAAFFSICGTIATAVIVMLAIRPSLPPATAFRAAPWGNWVGGPLGAHFVLPGAGLRPK